MSPMASRGSHSLLIIDDSPEVLALANDLLKQDYRLKAASSGEKGLQLARAEPGPDLILLDVLMPGVDGYEVCRQLKADARTRHIPVLFLSSLDNERDQEYGFEVGAADYICKPISGPVLHARIRNQLAVKDAHDFIQDKNQFLVNEVTKRAKEMEFIQDVTILALASLAETRDQETGNHIRRTQDYVLALAQQLQHHPHFSLLLTRTNIDLIHKSASLHDIGKVGVSDSILLKPGRLNDVEFEEMKRHAALGRQAIENAERQLGRSAPFLTFAKQIANSHHEKWDGSGYPEGLTGEAIPIPARLMAVADVYDALICRRVYKDSMSHEQAREIIIEGKGSHFDPDVVEAFVAVEPEFLGIAERFGD
ncbi:MAG: two-component system response regulator [Gammaproteobacteria bacterium SHHR-1]